MTKLNISYNIFVVKDNYTGGYNMTYGEFAKIYDELICEDIDYNLIEKKIIKIADEYNCSRDYYLDVACGTGNVSIKIARYFQLTYLVDLSEDMLQEAYEKFKKQRSNSKIICQDMRSLSLNKKFDLITCVLDSTNYILEIEDLEKYFSCIYNHLNDNGIFVFDINSYYKLTKILGNNIFTYNEDDVFYSWENNLENNVVNMYLTFFVKKGELYERFEEEHFERAYKEKEIEEALSKSGLVLLKKYNGYTENEVKEDSERILYVVKKKGVKK